MCVYERLKSKAEGMQRCLKNPTELKELPVFGSVGPVECEGHFYDTLWNLVKLEETRILWNLQIVNAGNYVPALEHLSILPSTYL